MKRIAGQPVLLADTGPFCRCAEAGQTQLDAAVDFLKPNTLIVQDVARELRRRASTEDHSRLTSMSWRGFPAEEPLKITEARLLAQLENIVSNRRRLKPGHYLEDRGEVATVLVAKRLGYAVLMDETWGGRLARRKGLTAFTTQDLAAELVHEGRLTYEQSWEIFRRVYRGGTHDLLREKIAALGE